MSKEKHESMASSLNAPPPHHGCLKARPPHIWWWNTLNKTKSPNEREREKGGDRTKTWHFNTPQTPFLSFKCLNHLEPWSLVTYPASLLVTSTCLYVLVSVEGKRLEHLSATRLVIAILTLWLCQNSYWKWPIEIVDFPMKNGGSFHSYVSLPEGTSYFFNHPVGRFFWFGHVIPPTQSCNIRTFARRCPRCTKAMTPHQLGTEAKSMDWHGQRTIRKHVHDISWLCVCILRCIHTFLYLYIHIVSSTHCYICNVYIHSKINHIYTMLYILWYTYIYVYIHIYIYTYIYIYIHIYIYIYIYIHIYIYIYIYIHIYVYTAIFCNTCK